MTSWTKEQEQLAAELWRQGKSAQEIALDLGRTRNAIIGKMNRLGITKNEFRKSSDTNEDESAEGHTDENIKKSSESDFNTDDNISEDSSTRYNDEGELQDSIIYTPGEEHRISLMYLTNKTCRWPIGDPSTRNFWFCGKPSESGKPYCTEHSDLAYQSNVKVGFTGQGLRR